MEPLREVEGRAIPYGAKNVDTDVIIPAHWLKTITREGLGRGAFETVRTQPGNVFDDPDFAGAPILIAGDNFGCGSSREHAAWALLDMGVRAVVAPSFSDIFASNAFKNGVLAVELPQEQVDRLLEIARRDEDDTVSSTALYAQAEWRFAERWSWSPFASLKQLLLSSMRCYPAVATGHGRQPTKQS